MINPFSSKPDVLNIIQLGTFIGTITGFFFVQFTFVNICLFIFFFYLYSIVGLSMTLHRYYTHKSFKMGIVSKYICTFIAIFAGRGSPLGWVYTHRQHHAYSDTENDPHNPGITGFRLFGFKPDTEKTKTNLFLIKDLLDPFHVFIDRWYLLILLVSLSIFCLINIQMVYFMWVLPVFLIQLSQNSFNYFAHTYGYRNFDVENKSTNNIFLWPFILGDAWHNNHHADPKNVTTKVKEHEYDPVISLINVLKRDV